MRVLRAAIIAALLMAPGYAHAQDSPHINLIPETRSLTPEEKEAEAVREKAYKESLKKIPNAKASSDPWGTVRSNDTPKTSVTKPRTKTGSTAN
jgi:hypothetical protein